MKSLGFFSLTLLTLSAVLNLRGIPAMAAIGHSCLIYYLLGGIGFLIPSTIISLALAKQYPEAGGVYLWVKASLGESLGFLAIWMEWTNNLISTPATLASLLGTLGFVGLSFLSNSPWHLFLTLWVIYLLVTWLNSLNIGTSSKLNIIGAVFGTLIPGLLIISLALIYFFHTTQHPLSLIPQGFSFNFSNSALFLSVLSGYSGMQITAFHRQNIQNPRDTLPKALILSCSLILLLSVGTALAISSIIPPESLQLITGVMQAFKTFFDFFNLGFLTPLLAIALAMGSLACMSAWVIGPARGFFQFAQDHQKQLPKIFTQINSHEMPSGILTIQWIIGTGLLSLYLWMPSITTAFWFLIVITSQFTLLMFALVFVAAIKVLKSYFLKSIGLLGLITVLIGFALSLRPPAILHITHPAIYLLGVLIADGMILGLPTVWLLLKFKPQASPTDLKFQ